LLRFDMLSLSDFTNRGDIELEVVSNTNNKSS